MLEQSTWVIYGLFCDNPSNIRYVGYTTLGPKARLKSHKKDANRRDYPLYRWMKSHGKGNVQIRVLEYCPEGDHEYLDYAEQYWIQSMKDLGKELLNIEYGGRGGRRRTAVSEETRKKLSAASRKGWAMGVRRDMKGVPKSDEWCRKMSDRMSGEGNPQFGRVWTPEQRSKHSESIKTSLSGRKHPMKGVTGPDHPLHGKPRSAETKERIRQSVLLSNHNRLHVEMKNTNCSHCIGEDS
jgi:group I intron endonuclease